jgi:integrase
MCRGEALALRSRDVDLDAGRLAVRRSFGVVTAEGAGERLVERPTKTGRSRVVDLDAGTVAALRACRAARGLLALDLVRDAALVLSSLDGTHRRHARRRPAGGPPRSTAENCVCRPRRARARSRAWRAGRRRDQPLIRL